MHDMHSMTMVFHFGSTETILFGFWKTETSLGIFCSCIVIMLACFCLEALRWSRIYRKKQTVNITRGSIENVADQSQQRLNIVMITDVMMHALQLTLNYMLMLVFMTFNIWLCFAVILGEVLARLLLSQIFPQMDLFVTFFGTITEPCCG